MHSRNVRDHHRFRHRHALEESGLPGAVGFIRNRQDYNSRVVNQVAENVDANRRYKSDKFRVVDRQLFRTYHEEFQPDSLPGSHECLIISLDVADTKSIVGCGFRVRGPEEFHIDTEGNVTSLDSREVIKVELLLIFRVENQSCDGSQSLSEHSELPPSSPPAIETTNVEYDVWWTILHRERAGKGVDESTIVAM